MRKWRFHIPLLALLCICFAADARADDFDTWFDGQVVALLKANAAKSKSAQSETVSVDRGSTTFVDQTSGGDLVTSAFNLFPVNGDKTSQGGSGAVSASAYAIFALATSQDALKPSVYNSHVGLRKVFLTVGREATEGSGTANGSQGVVYGVKFLPVNQRDATSIAKHSGGELAAVLGKLASSRQDMTQKLVDILYDASDKTARSRALFIASLNTVSAIDNAVSRLKPADAAKVAKIVKEYAESVSTGSNELKSLVGRLKRSPQFAVDFQTTQRKGTSPDAYRVQLIYDKGLGENFSLTLNGSYDYSNSAAVGADIRGGRAAIDLKYNITQVSETSLRTPIQFSLSGEATRMQDKRKYRGQVHLVIPLAAGINLPLTYGYGNPPDVNSTGKSAFGKFGLAFDFAKIVESLRLVQ